METHSTERELYSMEATVHITKQNIMMYLYNTKLYCSGVRRTESRLRTHQFFFFFFFLKKVKMMSQGERYILNRSVYMRELSRQ